MHDASRTTTNNEDARLAIQFSYEPVENEAKSREAGRPIYDEVEFIKIVAPGDRDNVVFRPVWDEPRNPRSDTARFARAYAAFKAGEKAAESGTPLAAWPGISRAQVEELKHFSVSTVEQLAAIADVHAQKFSGIQSLKQRARDFLEQAAGNAPAEKLRAELETRDAQIATLLGQVKELGDRVESLQKAKR